MGSAHDFIALPNTCQVEMVYSVHGQVCENVFHVTNDTGWLEADLTSIADVFKAGGSLEPREARERSERVY